MNIRAGILPARRQRTRKCKMLSVSKLLGRLPTSTDRDSIRYANEGRPVVVWNITKRCALHCVHCYNASENKTYPGELTHEQALSAIDSMAQFGVPVIIFSGGDPLLREDLFRLAEYAREKGVRAVLSANGIGMDDATVRKIKESGMLYVGVSLDGSEDVNDRLRGSRGAYNEAVEGLRRCRDAGLVVGVRFTMSRKTIAEMPKIFELIETERIQRGYFAHLVYAGRGKGFSREDLDHSETRQAVDYIFDKSEDYLAKGIKKDIVTGSNDVDGVYLYLRLKRSDPERAARVHALLKARGGNSSGVMLANIDNTGEVHPDQFWQEHTFGNVKERAFGDIWTDRSNALLMALKNRTGYVKGRCSVCPHFDICAGNYRVRAEFTTGDLWAEDPSCYLTDEELGIN